jgi:hypothetical protein
VELAGRCSSGRVVEAWHLDRRELRHLDRRELRGECESSQFSQVKTESRRHLGRCAYLFVVSAASVFSFFCFWLQCSRAELT